jgi:hypothetical protein
VGRGFGKAAQVDHRDKRAQEVGRNIPQVTFLHLPLSRPLTRAANSKKTPPNTNTSRPTINFCRGQDIVADQTILRPGGQEMPRKPAAACTTDKLRYLMRSRMLT